MSLDVAPVSAVRCVPAVGIFWLIAGTLAIDATALAEAETYGECLTHAAGHHERWEAWRALDGAARRRSGLPAVLFASEYDEWPRGRVVFEVEPARFVVYADRRLWRPETLEAIRSAFALGTEAVLRADAHYAERCGTWIGGGPSI